MKEMTRAGRRELRSKNPGAACAIAVAPAVFLGADRSRRYHDTALWSVTRLFGSKTWRSIWKEILRR